MTGLIKFWCILLKIAHRHVHIFDSVWVKKHCPLSTENKLSNKYVRVQDWKYWNKEWVVGFAIKSTFEDYQGHHMILAISFLK